MASNKIIARLGSVEGRKSRLPQKDRRPSIRPASALPIVDLINPLLETNAPAYVALALKVARETELVIRRARSAGIPVIYANDNFGNWHSDLPALMDSCRKQKTANEIVALIAPQEGDFTAQAASFRFLWNTARVPVG